MAVLRARVSDHPKAKKARATIVSDSGRRIELPFAPVEGDLDGHTPSWQTLPRTGRRPLVLAGGGPLPTRRYTLVLAHPDWHRSVQPLINAILRVAEDGEGVTFHYGGPERGRWRITGCPVSVLLRTPHDEPARATVELSLTRASDVDAKVGPLSGGAKKPGHGEHWVAKPAHGSERPHPGSPKTYVVRQGDTLSAIAGRVYGDPDDWHRIADANGIRDPRTLRVGQKLKIP